MDNTRVLLYRLKKSAVRESIRGRTNKKDELQNNSTSRGKISPDTHLTPTNKKVPIKKAKGE